MLFVELVPKGCCQGIQEALALRLRQRYLWMDPGDKATDGKDGRVLHGECQHALVIAYVVYRPQMLRRQQNMLCYWGDLLEISS